MITKQTVLILGAGASYLYGFQSGRELCDMIVDDHSSDLPRSMPETGFTQEELDNFKSE